MILNSIYFRSTYLHANLYCISKTLNSNELNTSFVLHVGGAFALYSLLCRYAKVSLIPNQQPEDRELSHYSLDLPSNHIKRAQRIRQGLEKSKFAKIFLVFLAILGTSMVIGDGVLTPCISGNQLNIIHNVKSYITETKITFSSNINKEC